MIIKFAKSNPELSETALFFNKPGGWADNILYRTTDDAKVIRWQEDADYIVAEFDRHPGNVANYGQEIDAFAFEKPDKTLIFDMKKCFDSGNDEHPSTTAARLKLICISYEADEAAMTAKMVVFDPFENLPGWVKIANY